jgi:hypothetical protein
MTSHCNRGPGGSSGAPPPKATALSARRIDRERRAPWIEHAWKLIEVSKERLHLADLVEARTCRIAQGGDPAG